MFTTITIYNLGEIKRVDSLLEYTIRDEEGNIVLSEKETVAVDTQAGFIRKFYVPKNVAKGNYLISVKALYDEEIAVASSWFVIDYIEFPKKSAAEIIFIVCLTLSIIYLLTKYYSDRQ